MKTDPRELARAAWFVQSKRRWPLALAIAFNAWFGLFAGLNVAGRLIAQVRLPESAARREALVSMAPPTIPDSENAATLWKQAGEKYVDWWPIQTGPNSWSRPSWNDDFWQQKSFYAAGSKLRKWALDNTATLEIALKAVQMKHCQWNPGYYKSPCGNTQMTRGGGGPPDGCGNVSTIFCARALLAAHDNDWDTVYTFLRASLMLDKLLNNEIDTSTIDAFEASLAICEASPPQGFLKKFAELAREQLKHNLDFAKEVEDLRIWHLADIDTDSAASENGYNPHSYFYYLSYSTFYPLDRALFQSGMDHFQEEAVLLAQNKFVPQRSRAFKTFYTPFRHSRRYFGEEEGFMDDSVGWNSTDSHEMLMGIDVNKETLIARTASWRMVLAGLGTLVYRQAHSGNWPKTLAQCGIEPELLIDPTSPDANTFKLEVSKEGVLVLKAEGTTGGADKDENGLLAPQRLIMRIHPPHASSTSGAGEQ